MFNFTRRSRLIPATVATVAAIAAIAAAPAAASAQTTWFGSSFANPPANAGVSCADLGVGPFGTCTHVQSYDPGNSGHAQAPVSGTITAIRIDPEAAMTFTVEVVNVRNLSSDEQSGQAQAVQRSRQITVPGPTPDQASNGIYPIDTIAIHLHVNRGQYLAINTASNQAEYCADGTPGQLLFDPVLAPGHGFQSSAGVDNCLMLVQAKIRH
jgi:hypothetical protein